MANGKKAAAPRRKYVKGRKFEQGYLDHLKESLGMRHGQKEAKPYITSKGGERCREGVWEKTIQSYRQQDQTT